MKKLILIPALLLGTLATAKQYKYEISPMIGYDIAEGNLDMNDNGYFVGGLELQINTKNSKISPEFSVYASESVDYLKGGTTRVVRGAFNGVYSYDKDADLAPFAKIGAGIEKMTNSAPTEEDGFFLDAGAGVKYSFSEHVALKLEAIYMAKITKIHAGNADSNLLTLAGLTFAFGGDNTKTAPEPVKEEPVKEEPVVAAVVVDGDDDKDGVLNSVDQCPSSEAGVTVDENGCKVDMDDDKDGVLNSVDQCPSSEAGVTVDENGCKVDMDDDKDGVLNSVDQCPSSEAGVTVDENGCKVDMDDDKDGILNSKDICPNTAVGEAVNSDGCPKTVALSIVFENNSFDVKQDSIANIDAYAEFLKTYTNYSAKIIGYTDSRGSAVYNQKLSEKRAKKVATMLKERGVNASQVTYKGMGEKNPIASNMLKEGRAQNRRIEAELTRH